MAHKTLIIMIKTIINIPKRATSAVQCYFNTEIPKPLSNMLEDVLELVRTNTITQVWHQKINS